MVNCKSDRLVKRTFLRYITDLNKKRTATYEKDNLAYAKYLQNLEETRRSLGDPRLSADRKPPSLVIADNQRLLWYLPENGEPHFDDDKKEEVENAMPVLSTVKLGKRRSLSL